MPSENRRTGSNDPRGPARPSVDEISAPQEMLRQPGDLRSLIRNLKESEKQLGVRCSFLESLIDGATAAIFSLDTDQRYISVNRKHAEDIRTLYGTKVSAGGSLGQVVPVEQDATLLSSLARRALAGEECTAGSWFGDGSRSRRYFDLVCYPVSNEAGSITGTAFVATDSTRHRQAEEALRERETRFYEMAEHSPDFLYRVSVPKGTCEYVSPSAETVTGYPPEEFSKRPGLLYEMIHSASKDSFGRHMELLRNGSSPPAAEFRAVHRNGEERWWLVRTAIIHNSAGDIVAYEGVITDITGRKNKESALAAREEHFRSIAESAGSGVLLVDAKTHIIADANARALRLIGATRDRVIGTVCRTFLRPAESGKLPATELPERGNTWQDLLTMDGRTVPVIGTTVPVTIAGREFLTESFIDISEERKALDTLRESEERYRAFVADGSSAVFRIEAGDGIPVDLPPEEQFSRLAAQGILAECNTAMARMYGFETAAAMTDAAVVTVIDNSDFGTRDAFRKFVCSGYHAADQVIEEHLRDGNTRWLERSMDGVVTGGRIVRIWGIQRDITERRNAELLLQKSEAQHRNIVEHATDLIFALSADGVVTSVNPTVTPLLGYHQDEFAGCPLRNFVRQESWRDFVEAIERTGNGSGPGTVFAADLVSKDGRSVPCEITLIHLPEDEEAPGLTGIARDISERKKSENELRGSEERFRTLLGAVPSVAVQGFSPDYSVIYWNEASTGMFGYSAEEAIGKDIRDLLLPPNSRAGMMAACEQIAGSGTAGSSSEQEFLHKDGRRVPVLVSSAIVTTPRMGTILFFISTDLTARKSAETDLKDAEQRLQSILDSAPFGTLVYELRDDGALVFVSGNGSAGKILMTDCSRYAGMTIQEAFPSLASTNIPDAFIQVIRTGEPFSTDTFSHVSGDNQWTFELHAIPLGPHRLAVFFRDISEKKKAEEELARSEIRFRSLIQNSPDIIQILDRNRQLAFSSPSFEKILGYPAGSQNGRNLLDLIHPDDRQRMTVELGEVYTGTNPGTPTEYRMITADGTPLFVESVGVNLLGIPGVDGIVINTHAVHERKLAEQTLSEREERFRIIFQHSSDSLFLFEIAASGMPGKIVDANDVAVLQTGYTRNELTEKTLPDLCSRDFSQQARAIMMELLTKGEARFETEHTRKDGSLLPVEISARIARIRDRTYVIAISRDISRRKREERALRIANQKLQLMNIVAWHDIQNKVTGLRGYVEDSKDLVTDEKLKTFIESEEEVLRVIHRQLQYTREYQEMGVHPPQWVNLPQVLRTIVSFQEIGPLKFRTDLHDLELYCDPVIEKVFTHLIGNSVKHGKTATEIHIHCEEDAGGLVLVYEDDGVGIPPGKKKELFARGVGSETGFSLFFVHDILEISDMGIRETGEPGRGVRFEITVPRGLYRGEDGRS